MVRASAQTSALPVPDDVRQSFEHFDKDRSGFIDRGELRSVLIHYGFEMPAVRTSRHKLVSSTAVTAVARC